MNVSNNITKEKVKIFKISILSMLDLYSFQADKGIIEENK